LGRDRQEWEDHDGRGEVVEANHRHVFRDADTELGEDVEHTDRDEVVGPWGSEIPIRARIPRYDRPMWSLLYLVARTLVHLLGSAGQAGRDDGAKDLEILVLRHQLRVLQRTAGRPQLHAIDRSSSRRRVG
jgi:hypothetical protein